MAAAQGVGNSVQTTAAHHGGTADPNLKSFTLQIPKVAGEGLPRRSNLVKSGPLVDVHLRDVTTLYEGFQRGVRVSGKRHCIGHRLKVGDTFGKYIWETYEQVNVRVNNFGSALVDLGLKPRDYVGVFSKNRPEWVIGEHACNAFSFPYVTLYDTLGEDACHHILTETRLAVLIVEAGEVAKILKRSGQFLSHLIICDQPTVSDEIRALAQSSNIKVHSFLELEQLGAKSLKPHSPPKPDDVATICYTSGTTGVPKGVQLTHGNIVADISGLMTLAANKQFYPITHKDVHLSYLPLAHMFERATQAYVWAVGGSIGFYQGNTLKLPEDMAALRPTLFPSVPRLFNRMYSKILNGINELPEGKKKLANKAIATKLKNLKEHGTVKHTLYDALIFKKMRARVGGNVRVMITGAAPISPEVLDFLRIAFSCEVYEGYGQTETSAGATLSQRFDYTSGHVGVPLPCNEIKLVDVPEMNYTSNSTPERGEVCYRGPNCFPGYLKQPEKTAEAIDTDGWVHSGDIGEWQADGTLRLIDRKKNIFKLAQGEYVAPEKIENTYQKCPLIAQAYVHGDSLEVKLVAVIVPDEEALMPWCRSNKIEGDFATVVSNAAVKSAILAEMKAQAKQDGLKGFEQVAEIHVVATPFSIENDMLTPTFKLKRNEAKKFYQNELNSMYATLKAASNE